mmetsp:Transcript_9193/g.41877  ORF Transcript_9193/g.41877 Transcript_9193/m.41877 type:complete len:298 (-) Transcript_9193:306-1199(-)
MSNLRYAGAPRSSLLMSKTLKWKPSSVYISSSMPINSSCRASDCSGVATTNISTLENWWSRYMPRVDAPAAPASVRKQCENAAILIGSFFSSTTSSMYTPPSKISAVPARHSSLDSTLYTWVFSARGWNPHFSMVLCLTKSGTTIGVKPLDTTFCMAQLMSASSSMAPAPVRYTNRDPQTLDPVAKSNIPSLSPMSTWLATSKEKSRLVPTSRLSTAIVSSPKGTSGCVSFGTFWPSVWSSTSSAVRSPSMAASCSLSALPSSTSAARTSGSILPFMLLALALRFSRISSHSRLSAW